MKQTMRKPAPRRASGLTNPTVQPRGRALTLGGVLGVAVALAVSAWDANADFMVSRTFDDPTPEENFGFGSSVALDAAHVLIGAPWSTITGVGGVGGPGEAHLFDVSTGPVRQTFNNPTPTSGDSFGCSVAVDNDFVLIGARSDDTQGPGVGQAYLFDISGNLLQIFDDPTLSERDGYGSDDFGSSMALDVAGNHVLIGAPGDDTNEGYDEGLWDVGQAYLFDISGNLLQIFDDPSPTGDPWFYLDPFPEPSSGDNFGTSVALELGGDRVVIGAPLDDSISLPDRIGVDFGEAYLFDTSGNLLHTFDDPTPNEEGGHFGSSVAIDSNFVLIGEPSDDTLGNGVGQAHLFDTSGNLLQTFDDPTPNESGRFGSSVAIDSNFVLIGGRGEVHLFDANTRLLLWTFDDPMPSDGSVAFALSVALDGIYVLVGERGQAHLFCLEAALDQQQSDFVASPGLTFGGASDVRLAQVVTAGVDGELVRVDLPVSCIGGDLMVEIYSVVNDRPNRLVSSQMVPGFDPANPPHPFRFLLLETPIRVTAGEQFAIVVRGNDAGVFCGMTQGPPADPYPGGDAWRIVAGSSAFPPRLPLVKPRWEPLAALEGRADLPFRTWIDDDIIRCPLPPRISGLNMQGDWRLVFVDQEPYLPREVFGWEFNFTRSSETAADPAAEAIEVAIVPALEPSQSPPIEYHFNLPAGALVLQNNGSYAIGNSNPALNGARLTLNQDGQEVADLTQYLQRVDGTLRPGKNGDSNALSLELETVELLVEHEPLLLPIASAKTVELKLGDSTATAQLASSDFNQITDPVFSSDPRLPPVNAPFVSLAATGKVDSTDGQAPGETLKFTGSFAFNGASDGFDPDAEYLVLALRGATDPVTAGSGEPPLSVFAVPPRSLQAAEGGEYQFISSQAPVADGIVYQILRDGGGQGDHSQDLTAFAVKLIPQGGSGPLTGGGIVQDQNNGYTNLALSSPFGQTFVAETSGVNSVGFHLWTAGVLDITIDLYEGFGLGGQLIATRTGVIFDAGGTFQEQWADLDFSGVPLTVGQTYTAIVRSNTPDFVGASIYAVSGSDLYPAGIAIIHGQAAPFPDLDAQFRVLAASPYPTWDLEITAEAAANDPIFLPLGATSGSTLILGDDGGGAQTERVRAGYPVAPN